MEWRKDGAGHHHYCWSQFLAGYIHPVWWHPPDDGRQPGGGRGAGGSINNKQTAWWSAPSSSTITPGGSKTRSSRQPGGWSALNKREEVSFLPCFEVWEEFKTRQGGAKGRRRRRSCKSESLSYCEFL